MHLSFLVFSIHTLALEHGELTIKQEIAKPLDSVALPILDEASQFFHCQLAFLTVNGGVRSLQDGRRSLDTV